MVANGINTITNVKSLNITINGKITLITTRNELQSERSSGSTSGVSKDGRIEDGRIAATSSFKQDQNGTERA